MAEGFEGEKWTFYEGIVAGEEYVVPYGGTLDGGQPDDKADSREENVAWPLLPTKSDQARAKIKSRRWLRDGVVHE
jgi:hypothetical protein